MAALLWQDYLALALYFAVVLSIGLYATCRANTSSAQGYFLAGKSSNWFLIGTSTFATNVGAPMFIGMTGTAAASGVAVTMFEWQAMAVFIMLGWVFVPVYRASGCYTLPQYLHLRFGGERLRVTFAVLGVCLSIVWHISSHMYTGALFIQQIFDLNMYAAVLFILAVTTLYTVVGGLTAVLWTDAIQTIVMVGGATALCIISLVRVGGWSGIVDKYPKAASAQTIQDQLLYGNHSCGLPRKDWIHIFRDVDSDYPWTGMMFGQILLALFVWCNDQITVQRSLSAKNMSHVKAGLILAAFLKITSFVNFTLPGLMARILFPDEVACSDPATCTSLCENHMGCTNIAYPLLVNRILPAGMRGLMLAAVLAGLMSSLTSVFNSSSSLFTIDIYSKIRKNAKTSELMVVGRIFVLLLVGLSIAWLPILQVIQGAQLWDYLLRLGSYTFPPFVAAFLMGIFWKRTTEPGAFYGVLAGLGMGVVRIGLEFSRQPLPCGDPRPDPQLPIVTSIHFHHFAILDFLVTVLVTAVVSLVTTRRSDKQLARMTFWTRNDPHQIELPHSANDDEVSNGNMKAGNTSNAAKEKSSPSMKTRIKRRLISYFCGVELDIHRKLTPAQEAELIRKSSDISENPRTKRALDVAGVLTCALCVFLHAFFY